MKKMIARWLKYLIKTLFSFRTPIGVKEYRFISLFLLGTYFVLKFLDSFIIPIFTQRYATGSSGGSSTNYDYWGGQVRVIAHLAQPFIMQ